MATLILRQASKLSFTRVFISTASFFPGSIHFNSPSINKTLMLTRHICPLSTTAARLQKDEDKEKTPAPEEEVEDDGAKTAGGGGNRPERMREGETRDPKDRTRVIPLETSLRYMESAAYRETYGDSKVWELYRRNYAKGRTYKPTRKKCIRHELLATSNPCPICRDEYLVVDYRNTKLLEQFLTDYNGEMLTSKRTGVCQEQWIRLRVELEKAKDHGYLRVDPPFVEYDYDMYMPKDKKC